MNKEFHEFSHTKSAVQNSWGPANAIHNDLLATKDLVYDPCGFKYSQPLREAESREYGAYVLEVNDLSLIFRVAKTTPTKVGQFVTLWKRIENGPIQPYDICDSFDFFIVSVRKDGHFGQFVFPKAALFEQGIISKDGKNGKRAMRVYPPWDITLNRQAQKTQEWQIEYFLEIPQDRSIECARAQRLYSPI